MKRKPWMKFYPADWMADPHLRMCRPESHGLLIALMSLAHQADPYGYLVNGGMAIGQQEATKILAWNGQTVGKAWAELEHHGRIVKADNGCWCIPRMVKDHAYSLKQSDLGKQGGNPRLIGGHKGGHKPEAEAEGEQKTEQKREQSKKASAAGDISEKHPAYATLIDDPQFRCIRPEQFLMAAREYAGVPEGKAVDLVLAESSALSSSVNDAGRFFRRWYGIAEERHIKNGSSEKTPEELKAEYDARPKTERELKEDRINACINEISAMVPADHKAYFKKLAEDDPVFAHDVERRARSYEMIR